MAEIIELDNGIYARIVEGLTNSGIIVGPSEILIIDSLRVPSHARDLIDDVKRISNKPIKYLIDTHSHWDHSWGNEEFIDMLIIGHENCYKEMIDGNWNKRWKEKILNANDPWSDEAQLVNITPPNLTFSNEMNLHFEDKQIILKYFGKAHTSGDVFIHLVNENVLFTGDVTQNKGIPFFGDSYPIDWLDTASGIINVQPNIFVGGHGPIGNYKDMVDSIEFVDEIINESIKIKSFSTEERDKMVKDLTSKLKNKYQEWRKIDTVESSISDILSRL
jgi:glyoxylase-like metal-dependent hydrolase (beta-lactamase superfamily II)